MNPKVDTYLLDGCMRCQYGGTPQCKVHNWQAELQLLRAIVLATGLTEEIKWGVPVYTHQGRNIVLISALKNYAAISFFKGVLLSDTHKILLQQGNLQSDRLIKFTAVAAIEALQTVLQAYILEAIAIEESGQKVVFRKNPEPMPAELAEAFDADPSFKEAFFNLTSGRQRAYLIHFGQAKQSATRISRINKYKQQILNGIGLHDKYSC